MQKNFNQILCLSLSLLPRKQWLYMGKDKSLIFFLYVKRSLRELDHKLFVWLRELW